MAKYKTNNRRVLIRIPTVMSLRQNLDALSIFFTFG
jgi:hypothetical protein